MTEPTLAAAPAAIESSLEVAPILVPMNGRDILCKGLNESQYMQMVHEAALFRSDTVSRDRKMKGLDRLFRVMISLVVHQEDKDFVEDQMADGLLDMREMVTVINNLYNGTVAQAPQKARRGRPAKRQ